MQVASIPNVHGLAFSPYGQTRALGRGSPERRASRWDMQDSSERHHLAVGSSHGGRPCVSFWHDGQVLAAGLHAVRLWRASEGLLLREFGAPQAITRLAWSRDGALPSTWNPAVLGCAEVTV